MGSGSGDGHLAESGSVGVMTDIESSGIDFSAAVDHQSDLLITVPDDLLFFFVAAVTVDEDTAGFDLVF